MKPSTTRANTADGEFAHADGVRRGQEGHQVLHQCRQEREQSFVEVLTERLQRVEDLLLLAAHLLGRHTGNVL